MTKFQEQAIRFNKIAEQDWIAALQPLKSFEIAQIEITDFIFKSELGKTQKGMLKYDAPKNKKE